MSVCEGKCALLHFVSCDAIYVLEASDKHALLRILSMLVIKHDREAFTKNDYIAYYRALETESTPSRNAQCSSWWFFFRLMMCIFEHSVCRRRPTVVLCVSVCMRCATVCASFMEACMFVRAKDFNVLLNSSYLMAFVWVCDKIKRKVKV